MKAALEVLDSVVGAGLSWYRYNIRKESKLKTIKRVKTLKITSLKCLTCIAACCKEHFSIPQYAQRCYVADSNEL